MGALYFLHAVSYYQIETKIPLALTIRALPQIENLHLPEVPNFHLPRTPNFQLSKLELALSSLEVPNIELETLEIKNPNSWFPIPFTQGIGSLYRKILHYLRHPKWLKRMRNKYYQEILHLEK